MEVWALEAYGAAHVLKEMLTIKSDDLVGRTQAYSAMIQGKTIPESTVPETFKLLVRQMNGLSLGLEVLGGEDAETQSENTTTTEAPEVKQEILADETEVLKELSAVETLEETPDSEAAKEDL
jgi:DNA-directed RNA polymerase subunit beta